MKWFMSDKDTTWRTPQYDGPASDDRPVTAVSWNDAVAFCNWLSAKEHRSACYQRSGASWERIPNADGYRLPTEAQWEYACRAGTTRFFSPDVQPQDVEPYIWCNPYCPRAPQPVATKQPNAFGLYDMHGNVGEWCQDFYDPGVYARSSSHDPIGPNYGGEHVTRGGDWYANAIYCRSARRGHFAATSAMNTRGFRVVLAATAASTSNPVVESPPVTTEKAATPAGDNAKDTVILFDGKKLLGMKFDPKNRAGIIRDGLLTMAKAESALISSNAKFANFVVTIELAASRGTEAWVGVRLQPDGKGGYSGIVSSIVDDGELHSGRQAAGVIQPFQRDRHAAAAGSL